MYNENFSGIGGGIYGLIAVLVVLFLFGGSGNGMWGNNNNNSLNTIELLKGQQNLQNQMSANALSQLQNANTNNISQLQTDFQGQMSQMSGFANLNNAIGQQTSAMQLMGANIMSQQQNCCCETQKELIKMAGNDQLAICQQTNALNTAFNNALNQVRTDLSALGYNLSQATSAIITNNNNGVQAIKDLCNSHWNQDLLQKYNDAKNELSQNQQTLALTTQLNAIASAIARIPTTATTGA